MATIIRVKRRLDQDPAEGLVIQYKRSKADSSQQDETDQFQLSLVTTVNSKEASVSKQVQKALRVKQLQTSYKAHDTSYKAQDPKSKRTLQTRAENKATAKANRYKVVNSRRALAEEETFSDSEETGRDHTSVLPGEGPGPAKTVKPAGGSDSESGSHLQAAAAAAAGADGGPGSVSGGVGATGESACEQDVGGVQVFDVEQDGGATTPGSRTLAQSSGITLNGQSLVSQPVPISPERRYVYDLYYIAINNRQYNFRDLENILSIEALHDELVQVGDRDQECEDVCEDDDDDSNDESNWRNDYPDEDPDASEKEEDEFGLFADEPKSKDYKDDDFLADTMGTKLHLFGDSSSNDDDEEDEYSYRQEGRVSYERYMERAQRDLESDNLEGPESE